MEQEIFNRVVRSLGSAGTRRGALGAIAAAGLTRVTGDVEAKKNNRNHKCRRKNKRQGLGGTASPHVPCVAGGCLREWSCIDGYCCYPNGQLILNAASWECCSGNAVDVGNDTIQCVA